MTQYDAIIKRLGGSIERLATNRSEQRGFFLIMNQKRERQLKSCNEVFLSVSYYNRNKNVSESVGTVPIANEILGETINS